MSDDEYEEEVEFFLNDDDADDIEGERTYDVLSDDEDDIESEDLDSDDENEREGKEVEKKTAPIMNKFEKARIIAERMEQLDNRYPTTIPEYIGMREFWQIREKALKEKFPELKKLKLEWKDFNMFRLYPFYKKQSVEFQKILQFNNDLDNIERLFAGRALLQTDMIALLEFQLGRIPEYEIIRKRIDGYEIWHHEDFEFFPN